MTTSPSKDVSDILEEESALGLIFSTNLFVGKEPARPDFCVTIFDTYGLPPQLNLQTQGYEYPTIQIRVRSNVYLDGWNMIEAIKALLHGREQEVINTVLYTCFYCASGPALLDWDENNRARFICNFNLQRSV